MCNITTGKLDANQAVLTGAFPFYTCAEYPDTIDSFAFDDDVVLVAGNNANGNFHVNRYNGKFNAYQRTYVVTAKQGTCIDYVYYALKLELRRLKERAQGSQTKFLTMPILTGINFNDIDFDAQKEISQVLASIDKKIQLNNKINAELEAIAKLIYDYWFVQFDFPDANGKPYKSSGGKMVYNEELKRKVPEGWKIESLMEIASFTNGVACQKYSPKGGEDSYRVIKIREMGAGFTDSSDRVSKNIPDKVVVYNGDVLFSWSATLDVMIWSGGIGGLNQHIFKVTSDKYPRTFYYFEVLRYLQHFKMIADLRKTTMGHITQDHLKQSRISIPPDDLAESLHVKLNPILNKIVCGSEENIKLVKLRDWLLPMLMNGQVTIKES
jgi:type I restriction enzyme S subunit